MALNETPITLVGNMIADPELRFTPGGDAVANFRVASTPRVYSRESGQYEDGEALFLTCSVWRDYAEHVAETLGKGMRVIVNGRLKQRSYQNKDGENRTVYEVDVDEVGPSLRFATAQVHRIQRQGNAGGGNGGGQSAPSNGSWGGGILNNGGFSGNQGNQGNGGFSGNQPQQQPPQQPQQQMTNDPWGSAPVNPPADDEAPF